MPTPSTQEDAETAWGIYYYGTHLPDLAKQKIKLLEWQLWANDLMLYFVLLLCFSGVVLAGLQLFWSRKQIEKIVGGNLTADASKINVASPFVGLLILVVSFSFFYLYVTDVYSIKNQMDNSQTQKNAAVK